MRPVQKVLTTILWGLMVLAMVSVIGARLWQRGPDQREELPVLADAPAFSLTDQDAKPITLQSLKGKPWIGDFVFTHCAGPCPLMTAKMARLQKDLPSPNLHFVSFSVDPERDTPAVLKEYAQKFQADESRWRFLTGTSDAAFAAAKGMLLTAIPANEANPIIHSTKFVLVDGEGRIRQYYDYNDAEQMKALVQDAAVLARDEAAGAGAGGRTTKSK